MQPSSDHSELAARITREWEAARGAVSAYVGALVHNRADREDVLQQTILYLLEHAADYKGDGFVPWAIRVAKFRILELWRRNKYDRRMRSLTDVADAVEAEFPEAQPLDKARAEALRACLAELPAKHRQLVEQRYRAGTELADLSTHWRRSVGTLSVALHRIRNALARCIERRLRLEESA